MHSIHTTPGFIIGSRPYGEAGKILSIFTRDNGLVTAVAQGIRLERSKLRPFIQDYSIGIYSLVRGKELWRLTSAQEFSVERLSIPVFSRERGVSIQELIARLALLLRRLLQGEDPHPQLFEVLYSCIRFVDQVQLSAIELSVLESLVVFRMVHALGYVGTDRTLDQYATTTDISSAILGELTDKRTLMNAHINKALKESHL